MEEFIKHFAEQFEDTDTGTFCPETNFRDLDEWSSFTALSVMAMVCEEYDVELTADQMRSASTIKQLYDIIQSQK